MSTSKLRSSSSFLLSRSSSSLACFLNPGLTSSRASSCKVPGTWVNEGFSCCLEGVVEAQIFWAGATVLRVKSYWLMKFYGEFPNDCSPASQQPRSPAGHFCTFDQFCHQSWSSACNLWHQTLQTGFLEQSTTFEPASVVLTSPPHGFKLLSSCSRNLKQRQYQIVPKQTRETSLLVPSFFRKMSEVRISKCFEAKSYLLFSCPTANNSTLQTFLRI